MATGCNSSGGGGGGVTGSSSIDATNNLLSTSLSASASLATTPATTPTLLNSIAPKRLGYASPSTSVICEEVFDDACQPSAEEISDYAQLLGVDPVKESHLLYLAKEGLMAALPAEWKICYSEEKCGHYYHNTKTKQSQWDHPLDVVYRELVEQTRQKYSNVASAATPVIDNSDDVSQLDSGIRSMQGTDLELDNTATTTNEMSSPVNNGGGGSGVGVGGTASGSTSGNSCSIMMSGKKQLTPLGTFMLNNSTGGTVAGAGAGIGGVNGNGGASGTANGSNGGASTNSSGFSGGVSRFLESRTKNFSPVFMPVKNTRFEVAKTNPQISLAMKFAAPSNVSSGNVGLGTVVSTMQQQLQQNKGIETTSSSIGERKGGGFQLSGTGAMFLKSRRQIESVMNQSTPLVANGSSFGCAAAAAAAIAAGGNINFETGAGTPPGVKGILRDSSLTDMRRRLDRDDYEHGAISSEENKRVRFNLDEPKAAARNSPEEDPSSSRKLTHSPEVSINSDDDDAENDDLWDEDDEDDDEDDDDDADNAFGVCVGSLSLDSSGAPAQRGSGFNPFLPQDTDKHVRDIRVISVPKAQTIKMLKAQSFSIELPENEREHAKPTELARSQSVEVSSVTGASNNTAVSYLDKLKDNSVVRPLYEDTDSDSKGSSVRSFIINKSEQDSLHSTTGPTNPFDLDELGRKHSRDVEQLQRKLNQNQTSSGASAGGSGSGGGGNEKNSGLRTLKMASKLVGFLKKDVIGATSGGGYDANNFAAAATAASAAKATNEQSVASPDMPDYIRQNLEQERQLLLKEERERMEEQLQLEIDAIKREHEQKLKSIRHEYDLRLTSHQHQIEEAEEIQLDEYRAQLDEELDSKRKAVVNEHKVRMATLQTNHAEILQDLERDLKSEEEILKKEHATRLMQMRDKLAHELEMEKHRMRESGEDRLYEKVRCEKRLLEDKYRCLKEKYVRLKTDVKLSLERRNRRREAQAMHHQSIHTNTNTTTGSETERSISNKPSIGNSENRSLSYSTSCQERCDGGCAGSIGTASTATAGKISGGAGGEGVVAVSGSKPPIPPKTHLTAAALTNSASGKGEQQATSHVRERSMERTQNSGSRKPGIASKYIKHLQVNDDTTSLSQSDTTISNNYTKGRYLPTVTAVATPSVLVSDNGNSDSEAFNQECNQENNNNSSGGVARGSTLRKKVFSRTKSASTSRLNSDNYGKIDRPCTPVENLRHQLQKLEDLEDQFPDNTLDTTYHLRYPFTDISNDHGTGSGGGAGGIISGGTSSELEFFKHRIHLERDSVRRAKESLRTQRTNFRARQREIKQRHKSTVTRHTLDQLIQEEKELTEMEVNLHRTRALLGEKVIRLRHLEQSLLRIYEKEKPMTLDLLNAVEQKDDATLSDLSSHSSSGFSSTDFASGADLQNLHKRKEYFQQESNECIQNLEILNAEIREILDILGQRRSIDSASAAITMPMISPSELSWSNMLSTNSSSGTLAGSATATIGASSSLVQQHNQHPHHQLHHHQLQQQQQQQHQQMHMSLQHQHQQQQHQTTSATIVASGSTMPQSIPTLADRLETYRQLAAGRMQTSMGGAILAANTIVSQSPRAVNYTTSLVERTRDLRNWLRQAKTEHELLVGLSMQHGVAFSGSSSIAMGSAATSGIGSSSSANISGGGGGSGAGASAAAAAMGSGTTTNAVGAVVTQTNL